MWQERCRVCWTHTSPAWESPLDGAWLFPTPHSVTVGSLKSKLNIQWQYLHHRNWQTGPFFCLFLQSLFTSTHWRVLPTHTSSLRASESTGVGYLSVRCYALVQVDTHWVRPDPVFTEPKAVEPLGPQLKGGDMEGMDSAGEGGLASLCL